MRGQRIAHRQVFQAEVGAVLDVVARHFGLALAVERRIPVARTLLRPAVAPVVRRDVVVAHETLVAVAADVDDVVAVGPLEHEAEVEILERKAVGHAAEVLRVAVRNDRLVIVRVDDVVVARDVLELHVARLHGDSRERRHALFQVAPLVEVGLLVNAVEDVSPARTDRVSHHDAAYFGDMSAGDLDRDRADVAQRYDLVAVEVEVQARRPCEVAFLDIDRVDRKFETLIVHLSDVLPLTVGADLAGNVGMQEHVLGLFVVNVGLDAQTVAEHADVQTSVELVGRLPLEVGIRYLRRRQAQLHGVVVARIVGLVGTAQRLIGRNAVVTRHAVAEPQFHVAENLLLLHELLLADAPCEGGRGEVAVLVVLAEFGRTVAADRSREDILFGKGVIQAQEFRFGGVAFAVGLYVFGEYGTLTDVERPVEALVFESFGAGAETRGGVAAQFESQYGVEIVLAARNGVGQRVGGLPRFGAALRDDGHAVLGVPPRCRRGIPLLGLRIQDRAAAADTQRQVLEDLVFEVEVSDRTVLGGSLVGVVDEGDGVGQIVVFGVGRFVIVLAQEDRLVEDEALHQSVVRVGARIGDGSLGHDVGEVDRAADGEPLAEVAVETDATRETFHLVLLDDALLIEVACRSGHLGLRAAA